MSPLKAQFTPKHIIYTFFLLNVVLFICLDHFHRDDLFLLNLTVVWGIFFPLKVRGGYGVLTILTKLANIAAQLSTSLLFMTRYIFPSAQSVGADWYTEMMKKRQRGAI